MTLFESFTRVRRWSDEDLPALIEHPGDGYRYLLLPEDPTVSPKIWAEAYASGAVAILRANMAMLAEHFMEYRTETGGLLVLPTDGWIPVAHVFAYADLLNHQAAPTTLSGGFVHLHAHSEYSPLDGLSTVSEMVEAATADGQPALAVTDHGVCAAHPELQAVATKAGIKPIFGIEANFVNDRLRRGDPEVKGDAQQVLNDYYHLILWAETDAGLHNLWAMSTEANRDGFYGRPRMDWATLERFSEGVMASTACLRGPVTRAVLADDEELARQRLSRLMQIFDNRLWVELHTNQLADQVKANTELVRLAHEFSLPTIAVVDSHYQCADDSAHHQIWIAAQTNKDLVADDADLFTGQQDYHVMTEFEVNDALRTQGLPESVVDEAIAQTLAVADRCNAHVVGQKRMPTFSREGGEQRDVERLTDLCIQNWSRIRSDLPIDDYIARFEREMDLLIRKGFCGYYLMVADYVGWAKSHGILVGPGRGSGGGSLVAYLAGITNIDPLPAKLLFERFLTEGRDSPPDFDVDFPASKRDEIETYIRERWGDEHVVRVGTVTRLKSKGVIRDIARVLKTAMDIDYRDLELISKIITDEEMSAAGLGIAWDDLWAQHGERLMPYREKYPELFDVCDRLVGRLKTYGRHAAGVVVSPDVNLWEMLPLRKGEEGQQMISAFDMDALELLGHLKFDILTLRTLDTIQMCIDLVEEQFGDRIDVESWDEEYDDPQVWDEICDGKTLGIFQIETRRAPGYTKQYRPHNLHELADIITLVRPGPGATRD
jgi:DNA polymerase-3 subunit alpha